MYHTMNRLTVHLMYFLCDAGTIAQGALSLPPPPMVHQGVLVLRASTVPKGPLSQCPVSPARTRRRHTPLGVSAVHQAGTAFLALYTCVQQVGCQQQQQQQQKKEEKQK